MNWNLLLLTLIGQTQPGAPAAPEGASVIALVAHAGPVVKGVLVLLVLASVVSWAIIFLKFLLLRRAHQESEIFLKIFWESRQLDEIYRSSKELVHSPLSEVFSAGYNELARFRSRGDDFTAAEQGELSKSRMSAAKENVSRALMRAMREQVTKLERAVPFLATVGNTAPFVGLFGTVWGIMDSFHHIGLTGQASLAVVAPGISEALVATAVGLFAAIPAVIAYNFFSSRLRAMESSIDSFSSEFMNILERHILL
jgi:biopolymer transport protein TolQ